MIKPEFTFTSLEKHYLAALAAGYKVITCAEYAAKKPDTEQLTIVNRVDIDLSVKKADKLRKIFDQLGIKATFFVRLHAPEYNPFSFENYRILKSIRDSGHEIGYHSEIFDQAAIWNEDAADCLRRDIEILNRMLNIDIKGIASHGGSTGLNNLDFWKDKHAHEFNVVYEAYDNSDRFGLFKNSFYISDSEWTQWKCYDKGTLCKDDRRTPTDHFGDLHSLCYMLIHPDTYFDRHFYE